MPYRNIINRIGNTKSHISISDNIVIMSLDKLDVHFSILVIVTVNVTYQEKQIDYQKILHDDKFFENNVLIWLKK